MDWRGVEIHFNPHAHPVAVGLEVPKLPGGEAAQVDGDDHIGEVAVAVPYLHALDGEGFGFPLGKIFDARCELSMYNDHVKVVPCICSAMHILPGESRTC